MTSSKVHKNVTHMTQTLLFDNFSPLRGKLSQKKNLLPLCSRKRLYILEPFWPSYTFWQGPQMTHAWGCRDSPFGSGVKNKFSKRIKSYFFHCKKIRKFSSPTNLCERVIPLHNKYWKFGEDRETNFLENGIRVGRGAEAETDIL